MRLKRRSRRLKLNPEPRPSPSVISSHGNARKPAPDHAVRSHPSAGRFGAYVGFEVDADAGCPKTPVNRASAGSRPASMLRIGSLVRGVSPCVAGQQSVQRRWSCIRLQIEAYAPRRGSGLFFANCDCGAVSRELRALSRMGGWRAPSRAECLKPPVDARAPG